jgi:hypothetical protein
MEEALSSTEDAERAREQVDSKKISSKYYLSQVPASATRVRQNRESDEALVANGNAGASAEISNSVRIFSSDHADKNIRHGNETVPELSFEETTTSFRTERAVTALRPSSPSLFRDISVDRGVSEFPPTATGLPKTSRWILLLGGEGGDGAVADGESNAREVSPLPEATIGGVGGAVGGRLVYCGGHTGSLHARAINMWSQRCWQAGLLKFSSLALD